MSRGGRGGGRGGRKGPDLSFDDSEPSTSGSKKPAPIFPRVDFPVPKPFDATEVASVQSYISYRTKLRNGPLYSVLDPSSLANDKGKSDQRAGFNPFNDQETYTAKSLPKKRTIPDVASQNPALQFFPKELWHIVDPKRKHPLWKTIEGQSSGVRPRKRKRPVAATVEHSQPPNEEEQNSDEDSDVVVTGQRRHNAAKSRHTDPTSKSAKQKQGLDAEDDYPDADPNEDEGGADDAPEDSEFDDSDDEGDDYNAEQYFDGGDDDDFGGDDGGEDETYG